MLPPLPCQIQTMTPPGGSTPLHPLVYRFLDEEGRPRHRLVLLKELAYLPLEAREDPDILGKQWAAVRGLYNGDIDFVYVAAGLYQPRHVGVVQFYGTAAEARDAQTALERCHHRMRAVEAVLANFVFSRLADPAPERLRTLMQRIQTLPSLLAILGHPDPRQARKGLARDQFMGGRDEEMASQQGEILLRGLSKLREEFVFLVTARRMERRRLTEAMVRMSRVSSQYASRQEGAINVGFSMAVPLAAALTGNLQGTATLTESEATGTAESWGESESQTETRAQSTGGGAAETRSVSHMEGRAVGETHTTGRAESQGFSTTDSQTRGASDTRTQTETESHAISESRTQSQGTAETEGAARALTRSRGESEGRSATTGSSWTVTESESQGSAESRGQSDSAAIAEGQATGRTQGEARTETLQRSSTAGTQVGVSGNASIGVLGVRAGMGASGGFDSSTGTATGESEGTSQSQSESHSRTQTDTRTFSQNRTDSLSASRARAEGGAAGETESWGSQRSEGTTETQSESATRSRGEARTHGSQTGWATAEAQSQGQSRQWGQAETQSRTQTQSESHARQTTRQVADTEAQARSTSSQWSQSESTARQESRSEQRTVQRNRGMAWMTGAGRGFMGGFSSGIIPGVSLGRSWRTEDETAQKLTAITRGLVTLLDRASVEGGFMTSALLLVRDEGRRAATALVPQAFHGPDVPTPVLTAPGDETLRTQALAFQPSLEPEPNPFDIDILWTRWSTLLTPSMLAAYTAPNLFEEGVALTLQERLPPLAFYPEMEGEAVCGHQISPETGDLTRVPLRLARGRHFHTAFCGDTGFGKSVAAERLVYESTRHWRLRSIVLDFGTGWRRLLNAPGLEDHVEIRQLSPGGVRPLCWNPLQIGRHILPEVQWRAFCDVFGQIAQLGQRRQVHELRDALRRVYLNAGVLVDDPAVQTNDTWGCVRFEEEELVDPAPGTPLAQLTPAQKQILAVHRSRQVGFEDLYRQIRETLATGPKRDMVLRTVLEGILFRLHPLVQGAASLQYAARPDGMDINDLVPGDWGVAVLEGGSFLDDFSKAFLLGWAAWHLYGDAVNRRLHRAVSAPADIQIVFEEANKILAGLDQTGEEGGRSVAEQFEAMWRDSRKYGIWLHLVTQTPSAIPTGILSSCNNIFTGQLKNPRDRDCITAALHRSEKGFVDESWRRFLASLPVAHSVVKLGYAMTRGEMEPTYIRPSMLDAPEPTDGEIAARLGTIQLQIPDRERS